METKPWYQTAVFYEVYVRAFFDSNGDGHGDLNGLAHKLDYLEELGIDCLWLLPIYPSPLVDDGYDISDYTGVHPDYGSLDDFRRLLKEAHRRGMHIITDLVVNHTSNQHPWFQAARASRQSALPGLLCLVRQRPEIQGRPDHLSRHRKLQMDLGSCCGPVLLAPLLCLPA